MNYIIKGILGGVMAFAGFVVASCIVDLAFGDPVDISRGLTSAIFPSLVMMVICGYIFRQSEQRQRAAEEARKQAERKAQNQAKAKSKKKRKR